jgi:hypothetical protein
VPISYLELDVYRGDSLLWCVVLPRNQAT